MRKRVQYDMVKFHEKGRKWLTRGRAQTMAAEGPAIVVFDSANKIRRASPEYHNRIKLLKRDL